ncbi:MAG: carboxypeptidase-like regulatory domain-containing protein [Vicinamibacterales bacterium]
MVDQDRKPIDGVTIRLVNIDRGREVTLKTDKDGRFYRRALQAVEYR